MESTKRFEGKQRTKTGKSHFQKIIPFRGLGIRIQRKKSGIDAPQNKHWNKTTLG